MAILHGVHHYAAVPFKPGGSERQKHKSINKEAKKTAEIRKRLNVRISGTAGMSKVLATGYYVQYMTRTTSRNLRVTSAQGE